MKTKMEFNYILYVVTLSLLASSCSILPMKRSVSAGSSVAAKKIPVEIKDVPFDARENDQVRKRVVVLPFLDSSVDRSPAVVSTARQEFIFEIGKDHLPFVLVDPGDLGVDLSKHLLHNEYNWTELAKLAGAKGVQALIEGKIIDLKIQRHADSVGLVRNLKSDIEAQVRIRVVETKRGRELYSRINTLHMDDSSVKVLSRSDSDRYHEEDPEMIQKLVNDAFIELLPPIMASLDKVSWEGRIALVHGDRIYINVGRISGLQVGDLLRVLDEGEEVFDPETGNSIGKVPGKMKGTLEVVSYFGQDGAVTLVHSGVGFKENDRVEMY